jgi:GNAT superfamily N-acetyltransferase
MMVMLPEKKSNFPSNLEFLPVTRNRWLDFVGLFESKGFPHHCWCSVWRKVTKKGDRPTKREKKMAMMRLVDQGIPIGIIAYSDQEPIAWCSIAPRDTYRTLGGDITRENVWSIGCFFVKRSYRSKGLAGNLLDAAIQYAKENGARYVEAYPVESDSPSYRFMGLISTFEKAHFKFVKMAGKRRHVMLLESV